MIVTLCGSARFEELFHEYNERLTLAGHTVFSLAVFPSYKGKKDWYTGEQKRLLDRAHKQKIDLSDAVVILDKGHYVGSSTLNEEAHALINGKDMYYLEGNHPHHRLVTELL